MGRRHRAASGRSASCSTCATGSIASACSPPCRASPARSTSSPAPCRSSSRSCTKRTCCASSPTCATPATPTTRCAVRPHAHRAAADRRDDVAPPARRMRDRPHHHRRPGGQEMKPRRSWSPLLPGRPPAAQELGRLFFTPEQRAALDARRKARMPDRPASSPPSRPPRAWTATSSARAAVDCVGQRRVRCRGHRGRAAHRSRAPRRPCIGDRGEGGGACALNPARRSTAATARCATSSATARSGYASAP